MVVKMMRWRPWPPIASRKYEVRLVVARLHGVAPAEGAEPARLMAEVRWKGARAALGTFRRTVKRNFTKEECLRGSGVVEWMEEFHSVCSFSFYKESSFLPWEVAFTVFKVYMRFSFRFLLLLPLCLMFCVYIDGDGNVAAQRKVVAFAAGEI